MSKKKKKQALPKRQKADNHYLAVLFGLIIIYFLSMVLVCAIPNSAVESHIMESIGQIQKNGLNPKIVLDEEAYKIDTFTDAIMLNMSYAADSSHPLSSAIEANQKIVSHSADVFNNIKAIKEGGTVSEWSYGRYWHGWLVPVRTLLVFFNYNEIRYLNTIVMFLLLSVFLILVYRKLGKKAFFAYVIGFALINFWLIPLCLHYSSVFYIALLAGLGILFVKEERFGLIFLIAGSLTSFLDLLSAPVITLGIPLIAACFKMREDKINVSLKRILSWCTLWAGGYIFTWLFKFLILALSGHQQVLQESYDSIALRSGNADGSSMKLADRFYNIAKNFNGLSLGRIGGVLTIGAILTAAGMLFAFEKTKLKQACLLFAIACIPFIWYILLGNHSSVHIWFTYRTLLVFLIAFTAAVFSLIDFTLLKKKCRQLVLEKKKAV